MKKRAVAVALLAAASVALTGCSASTTSSDTAAAACAPSTGKVDLTFTTWVPGMEDAVAVWNKANPDIQV